MSEGRAETRMLIAEVSARMRMHPQTLRKYERAGLLRPARRTGGSRHYSAGDLDRLALIKHLADERGINVAGIALALSIRDELVTLLETTRSTESWDAMETVAVAIEDLLRLVGGDGF